MSSSTPEALRQTFIDQRYRSGCSRYCGYPSSPYPLAAPNIALTGFPLSASLKQKYRKRVVMTNDVNAGLLGEAWLGAARGLSHVVGIFPGTGVGGAVISDGKLLLV